MSSQPETIAILDACVAKEWIGEMKARSRRALGALASGALVASLLTVISQVSPPPAAATTTGLVTAADNPSLAAEIVDDYFTSGSPTAVIAQDSTEAVQIAGTYAARLGLPVIVTASGTNASYALNELDDLGAGNAVLISSTPAWFSTGFQSSLTANSVTIDDYLQASDLFARWVLAGGTSEAEYALARTDNPTAVALATAYATSRRIPLVLWESATAASALGDFFDNTEDSRLVFFGSDVVPSDLMSEDRLETLAVVDLADLQRAYVWVASQAQLSGATSNVVVAAPSDEPDEIALAGVAAAVTGGVVAPTGASTSLTTSSRFGEYATLWKSGVTSLTLVGTGLTGSDLTAVAAPTGTAHAASPSFRVSNLTRTSISFTLTVTAVSGATSYTLYDYLGTPVTTSTTTGMTFSTPFSGGLVVADGSSGEIARIDVHFNSYDLTSSFDGVMTVDSSGGTNHLRFYGDISTPRVITRAVNDLYSEFPTYGAPIPIAITCASEFTDATADGTKEYVYEVADFTNVDVAACGSFPASAGTLDEILAAKVTAPPTEFPWLRPSEDAPRVAGMTHIQAQVVQTIAEANASSESEARGPGDDWFPVTTRWIAYIPEAKLLYPAYTGDPAKPFTMIGGDGHGTNDPNGSHRFIQDMTFYFGSSHSATYYEHMGTSHLYKCSSPTGSGCSLVASATAPLSELSNPSLNHGATWGWGRITASATLPLISIAPPITTDVTVYLSEPASWVAGYHDNMPKHEFYYGNVYSEYWKAYESSYLSYAVQLECLYAPDVPIPGCLVRFNAQI